MRYFVDQNDQVHSYNFLVSKEIHKLVKQASKIMLMKVDVDDEMSVDIFNRVMNHIVAKAIDNVVNNEDFLEIEQDIESCMMMKTSTMMDLGAMKIVS